MQLSTQDYEYFLSIERGSWRGLGASPVLLLTSCDALGT